jgi:hypothetical protein
MMVRFPSNDSVVITGVDGECTKRLAIAGFKRLSTVTADPTWDTLLVEILVNNSYVFISLE